MNILADHSPSQLLRFLADSLAACATFDVFSEEYADAAAEVRMIQAELERRATPGKGVVR